MGMGLCTHIRVAISILLELTLKSFFLMKIVRFYFIFKPKKPSFWAKDQLVSSYDHDCGYKSL